MMALAEMSHIDEACWMLDRLQRGGRVQCSKRLMYLAVEKGGLDTIKWHVFNCEAHDISERLYVATWIGREDVVEWMIGEWHEVSAERSIQEQLKRQIVTQQIQARHEETISRRKTMYHSLDAAFAEVEEHFAAGLMDVEALMNATEASAQRGDRNYLQYVHTHDRDMDTTNPVDLAAVYGHFDCVEYLLSEQCLSCTVSGLYGALTRGHFTIVKFIYQYQPRHSTWPREEAASVLRRLLKPGTEELHAVLRRSKNPSRDEDSLHWLLKFIRHVRNMRLDSHSLNEAAYRGDLMRVKLICQHDLVEKKSDAADIAATRCDLTMLEVLFGAMATTGPKCTTQASNSAAEGGHLEAVKYLHWSTVLTSSDRFRIFQRSRGYCSVSSRASARGLLSIRPAMGQFKGA